MARPPTLLKQLLDQDTPEQSYRMLACNGMLSRRGRSVRKQILMLIAAAPRSAMPIPGVGYIAGPSPLDDLESDLQEYLSERGVEASRSDPVDPQTLRKPRWWNSFW